MGAFTAIAGCAAPATATGQSVQPIDYQRTGTFTFPGLSESSGVAVSRMRPGVLWTHNDSGDEPRIYATNLAGENLGSFLVTGAEAIDWEDIATGPCPHTIDGPSCIYISDSGDNFESREEAAVYVVAEPLPRAGESGGTESAHRLAVRYPDRPRDVEALGVTPDGDLILISTGRTPPVVVYAIPGNAVGQRSVTATIMASLDIDETAGIMNQVTAAAVSPSGRLLAVRTYTQLLFFEVRSGLPQLGPACQIGLRQPQGEGVDFLDDGYLVLTSETALGRDGGIARARCPLGKKGPGGG